MEVPIFVCNSCGGTYSHTHPVRCTLRHGGKECGCVSFTLAGAAGQTTAEKQETWRDRKPML